MYSVQCTVSLAIMYKLVGFYLCLEEGQRPLLPLPGGLVYLEDVLQHGGRASVVTVTAGQAGRLAGTRTRQDVTTRTHQEITTRTRQYDVMTRTRQDVTTRTQCRDVLMTR